MNLRVFGTTVLGGLALLSTDCGTREATFRPCMPSGCAGAPGAAGAAGALEGGDGNASGAGFLGSGGSQNAGQPGAPQDMMAGHAGFGVVFDPSDGGESGAFDDSVAGRAGFGTEPLPPHGGASGSEGTGGSAGTSAPETAAGTGGGTEAFPWQSRSIVIVNETLEPRYLSMRSSHWDFFAAEDAGGLPCDLFEPWCSTACSEIADAANCLVLCEQPLEVRVLNPGEVLTLEWDGTVWETWHDYCEDGGSCFVGIAPKSASYSLRVMAHDGCAGDAGAVFTQTGVLYPAEVTGNSTVYEATMRADEAGDVVIAVTQ